MKGVKHYRKNGVEHKGASHKMPNGQLHSGKSHTQKSVRLFHFSELNQTNQKKARASWKK